jgi:sodium-dependent dicarboxylate transporter 2/3/5
VLVEIDRRPLIIIIGEKIFTPLIYILAFAIFLIILSGEKFAGLSAEGKNTLIIFFVCVLLWVGQVIPTGVTGLLAIVLLPVLKVMSTSEAYSLFGNNAVFFLIGVFILGAAIKISGLAARVALFVLNRFGNTPNTLLLSLYLLTFVMSWFMPEHVVAAIAFPIVLEIARNLNLSFRDNFGKILFLSLSWGCVIGGVATFLGGARVPLAVGMLHETTQKTITFYEYLLFGIPVALLLAITGFILLKIFFHFKEIDLLSAKRAIQKMLQQQGLMTFKEQLIALITIVTIGAWIFAGDKLGLANIAIISIVSLFVLKLINWRDVQDNVNWGIILMYGGAITLGYALEKSGASKFIAENILLNRVSNPFVLIALLALFSLILTAVMSNSATVAALLPIALAFGNSLNVDPRSVTLTVAFMSGIDFALPIGTPASAIAYSSGYLKISEMLFPGILMSILAWLIFILMYNYYLPLVWQNGGVL